MSAIYKFLEVPFGKAEKLNLDKIIQKKRLYKCETLHTSMAISIAAIRVWSREKTGKYVDPDRPRGPMCRQGARGCYLFKTIDDFTFVQ